MNIQIRGLHTSLTPAIEAYVEKRLLSLSKFIKNDSALCDVQLIKTTNHHRSGDIFKAEGSIDMEKEPVYAMCEREDLYQAVDGLRDELEHILASHKEKKITMFRRGAGKIKDMIKGIQPIERFKKWRK